MGMEEAPPAPGPTRPASSCSQVWRPGALPAASGHNVVSPPVSGGTLVRESEYWALKDILTAHDQHSGFGSVSSEFGRSGD